MDVACPGNPPFGRSRPPLVAGVGGGEMERPKTGRVVVAAKDTRIAAAREVAMGSAFAIDPISTARMDGHLSRSRYGCAGRQSQISLKHRGTIPAAINVSHAFTATYER